MIRAMACVVLAGAMGCGSGPATDKELAKALDVLKSGLDAWKEGKTPADLGETAFTDADWQAGAKLVEYRILKTEGEDGTGAVYLVKLKLEVRGAATERNVSYRATTAPARTVARHEN